MKKFFKWLLTTILTTAIVAAIVWGVQEWLKARADKKTEEIIKESIRDIRNNR